MYGLVTIPELSTGENYMYTLVFFPVVVVVVVVFCHHAVDAALCHTTKIWLHRRLELPGSLGCLVFSQ